MSQLIVWGRDVARVPLNVPTVTYTASLVQRYVVVLGWSSRLSVRFVAVGRRRTAGIAQAER